MIMLDEPMAGVNPALTQSLLGHIQALRDEGMTVLFVEHDMHMVRAHLRLGGRDGRGPARRRGHARHRDGQPGRHRRLPGRPPRHRPRRRRAAQRRGDRGDGRGGRGRGRTSARGSSDGAVHDRATAATAIEARPARPSSRPRTWSPGYLPGVNILNGCSLVRLPRRAGRHHRARTAPASRRCSRRCSAWCTVRSGQVHAAAARTSPTCKANQLVREGVGFVPADQQRLPVADHRGEPADGALPCAQEAHASGSSCDVGPVPGAARPPQPARGLAVRRRAADGGDGAGADDGAVGAAPRRAVGRPVAGAPGRDVHPHPPDQQDRRLRGHGRAERPPLPADLRPRLRARPGPQRLHRHRPRAGQRPQGHRALPRHAGRGRRRGAHRQAGRHWSRAPEPRPGPTTGPGNVAP